jgi:acyl dehydratase
VALNKEYVGRVFGPGEPYEVSRVKIADFADAIGERSELCRDPEAARKAGYPDVIAPPTFAFAISMQSDAQVQADPGLGLDYSMVVHGEQRFTYSRPLHAGDVVVTTTTIESIKALGNTSMLVTSTDISTVDGEYVCTAKCTIVERGQQRRGSDGAQLRGCRAGYGNTAEELPGHPP